MTDNNDDKNKDVSKENTDEDWDAALAKTESDESVKSEESDESSVSAESAGEQNNLDDWADALDDTAAKATPAEFAELDDDSTPVDDEVKFDVVLDIPVTISMEVGRTSITIRNLMKLNQGSVIELDRLAGEPLDIMVNGTLIAHGEVVIVNDKFGIRLTDVMSQSERIKKLQ